MKLTARAILLGVLLANTSANAGEPPPRVVAQRDDGRLAYLTADNGHVIFNADPGYGPPQVWAARVPAGFLESLE